MLYAGIQNDTSLEDEGGPAGESDKGHKCLLVAGREGKHDVIKIRKTLIECWLFVSWATKKYMELTGKDIVIIGLSPWYIDIGSNCKSIARELSRRLGVQGGLDAFE